MERNTMRNPYRPETGEEKFIRLTQYVIAGVLALCTGIEIANLLLQLITK
jgi:hypothetical protein